jgi:hypothetical protein
VYRPFAGLLEGIGEDEFGRPVYYSAQVDACGLGGLRKYGTAYPIKEECGKVLWCVHRFEFELKWDKFGRYCQLIRGKKK